MARFSWVEKSVRFGEKINWSLLLAGLVEIPRWSVAFMAIHEPAIFGVPLAAIITWSMSAGWERYFKNPKSNRLILFFCLLSVAVALIIITPVLYLLTEASSFRVKMTDFDTSNIDYFRLLWSFALGLSTFLPLIALAAVRANNDGHEKDNPKVIPQKTRAVVTPSVVETATPVESSSVILIEPEEEQTEQTDERKRLAWQMVQNGVKQKEVASHFEVTSRTVRNWLKEIER